MFLFSVSFATVLNAQRAYIEVSIQEGSSESTREGEEFFFYNRTIIMPFSVLVVKFTLHICLHLKERSLMIII